MNSKDIIKYIKNTFDDAIDVYIDARSYNNGIEINKVTPITKSEKSAITFCIERSKHLLDYCDYKEFGIVLIDKSLFKEYEEKIKSITTIIVLCNNAHAVMIDVIKKFFYKRTLSGISRTSSSISHSAIIGKNTYIGPNCCIDDSVVIGDNCIIHPNVVIKHSTIIGNNVVIHSNTTIGNEGFGFLRREDGKMERFPHIGIVVIEDDVEIGSGNCIDRAAIAETRICRGVKTDGLCHIAHNTYIGENTGLAACVMLAGGVKIGKNCWISPSVSFRDNISIGDNVLVGIGSVVVKDIPSNVSTYGVPAKIHDTKYHMVCRG